MPARTSTEYLNGLREPRDLRFEGGRVRDVANPVVVLGHPAFYPRFGFVTARPLGVTCEYPVPDEVFMVAQLSPGALRGRRGLVRYSSDFVAGRRLIARR